MNTFENKMTREFGAKVKIVMEEQYHNREKIKALEETIVKQKNEIAKLQNSEETLNLQRQEITFHGEISFTSLPCLMGTSDLRSNLLASFVSIIGIWSVRRLSLVSIRSILVVILLLVYHNSISQ
jgi:hypothetical protein